MSIVANGMSLRESIALASNSSDVSFSLDTFSHSLEFIPPLSKRKIYYLTYFLKLYPKLKQVN